MSGKLTPGPWRYGEHLSQLDDDATTVAQLGSRTADGRTFWIFADTEHHGDMEADARAISAVPEMVEAIRKTLAVLAPCVDDPKYAEQSAAQDALASALAKAGVKP